MKREYGIGILGMGKYIPSKLVTNQDIEKLSGVPEEEIVNKTGIITRYVVEDDEIASELSAKAATEALNKAGVNPEEIGLILGCTFSGEYTYPAMACKVQELLGAWNAGAYDVIANCTGFQVGIATAAEKMFFNEDIKYSLVIGTAVQSRYINWTDPNMAMYFGDGIAAAVLGRVPEGYGVLCTEVISNGRVYDAVRLRGGGSSYPASRSNSEETWYYEMNGMEVWKQVVQWQPKIIKKALEKLQLTIVDVDYFIFHQPNMRLIEYLLAKLKIPKEKTTLVVDKYGNTADASMAISLCEALEKNEIKRNDIVCISGVGAGFIFGATVMRWY